MFDRIEKFREHAPSVPEEQVMSYLTELENFLGSSCYAKTLGQIKPQIIDVYDILMSQSEDIEYLDKLNERMVMYLKQLHTLIQYHNHNQGDLAQEQEQDADSRGIEAVRYMVENQMKKIDTYLAMDINSNSKMRRDALVGHKNELEKINLIEKMDVQFVINQLKLKGQLLDKW